MPLYSIKMRASKGDLHVSGAERIIPQNAVGERNPAYTSNLPQHKACSKGAYWTADSDGEQIGAQKRHCAADNKTEDHLYNYVEDVVRTKHHTQHAG